MASAILPSTKSSIEKMTDFKMQLLTNKSYYIPAKQLRYLISKKTEKLATIQYHLENKVSSAGYFLHDIRMPKRKSIQD